MPKPTYNASTGLIDRSDNTEIGHDQTQTGNTTDITFTGSLFGRPNQVSVGFDVNRATFQHSNNTYTGSSGSVDPYHPDPGYYTSAVPYIPRYRNQADQYALFAEDRLELTGRWSIVAGTRFDHADLTRQDLVAGSQAFQRSYSNTGWRLGTVYKLQPDLSLYAQAAKAADPVSGLLMLSAANAAFDVSTGKQFEVGLKQSFWEGKGDWTWLLHHHQEQSAHARPQQSRAAHPGRRAFIQGTRGHAVTADHPVRAGRRQRGTAQGPL
jgi:iron complex outermembrane receptor protein